MNPMMNQLAQGNALELIKKVPDHSIDALVTDPPYGISYQNSYWDKDLPDSRIWKESLRTLKPGAFGVIFSSVRLMHRLMVSLEDCGFLIKDVIFWVYLNGMPKSRDVALDIDKTLGVESKVVGRYYYVQGYRKGDIDNYKSSVERFRREPNSELGQFYKGAGLGIKPAYEPIILIQKPIEQGLKVAQNIIKYGTGALNLEETRIPYQKGEYGVGHNPHPTGRVMPNILRTEDFGDDYDKFFVIPKVRKLRDEYNEHPTLKPLELMDQLVRLVSFKEQVILDPFMGSGSTGVAAVDALRRFYGYELDEHYFKVAQKRIEEAAQRASGSK